MFLCVRETGLVGNIQIWKCLQSVTILRLLLAFLSYTENCKSYGKRILGIKPVYQFILKVPSETLFAPINI
jgi:hypothetical protein